MPRTARQPHNHVFQASDVVDVSIFEGMGCTACALIRPDSQLREHGSDFRFWPLDDLAVVYGPTPAP